MLPVVYSASSSEFSSNGLGVLVDCISCKVTEERNGIFEMELSYPVNGQRAECLEVDAIIKAAAHRGDEGQLFRIYQIDKDLNGNLKILAQHISYQLSFIPCGPFYADNVVDAFEAIRKTMQTTNDKFTFFTDKTTKGKMYIDAPVSTRSALGGMEGSALDIYHGEYEFDNFKVKLLNHRGEDRGVVLKYGKNISSISQEIDIANVYTGFRPYYYDSDELVELPTPDKCLWSTNADSFPYPRVMVLDVTSEFSELTDAYGDKRAPYPEELLVYAVRYFNNHTFGEPSINIKVSFEALWDTDEYASIASLEAVNLCDTISVVYPAYNISAKAKIIKTVYNSLLDKYESLEIGNARSNFSSTLASIQQESTDEITATLTTRIDNTRKRITDTLLGKNGGYKTEKTDANGNIVETLYMDTMDEGTATKVWRWNVNGLGYSPNGANGPYTLAMTKDGEIVADFITTGTLDANNVDVVNLKAQNVLVSSTTLDEELTMYDSRITANAKGLTSKVSSTDYTGKTIASLINQSSDSVTILANHINLNGVVTANQTFKIDTDGSMTATGGTIGGFTIGDTTLSRLVTVNDVDYNIRLNAPVTITPDTTLAYSLRYKDHDSDSWKYPWYVRYDGYMFASNARVKGQIEATSGEIGSGTNKITIGTDTTNASIYYNKSSFDDTTKNGFYIGTDGIAIGKNGFKVSSAGALTAVGANVSGVITATSGAIGNFRLSSSYIDSLSTPTGDSGVQYRAGIFTASDISSNTDAFRVTTRTYTKNGDSYTYGGWSTPFTVKYDGSITAGNITITGGTIGGCQIATINNIPTLQVSSGNITSVDGATIEENSITADQINASVFSSNKMVTGLSQITQLRVKQLAVLDDMLFTYGGNQGSLMGEYPEWLNIRDAYSENRAVLVVKR